MARVNEAQKKLLIDFMDKNASILFGKFSSGSGKHRKESLWNELAKSLNELGPPAKNVANWKNVILPSIFFSIYFYAIFCVMNVCMNVIKL